MYIKKQEVEKKKFIFTDLVQLEDGLVNKLMPLILLIQI